MLIVTSRSATVLVIFVIAIFAFCFASVFAAMTGPISIFPNETDSGGILDNLSAITDDIDNSDNSYGYQSYDYSSYSSSDSSDDSKVETTTEPATQNNPVEKTPDNSQQSSSGSGSNSDGGSSSGSSSGSGSSNVETTTG